MKITRKDAVAFLISLGFAKADEWDDVKLSGRLVQVPERLTQKDVTNTDFLPMYEELSQNKGGTVTITDEGGKERPAPVKKQKAIEKTIDRAAKAAKEKDGKKPTVTKADSIAAGKARKTKKEPKVKKEKKAREVDAYGSAVGTVRAKVNAVFSKEWRTDEETAKDAGVTTRQARVRLRRAVKGGLLEKRRRIEYRLLPSKK